MWRRAAAVVGFILCTTGAAWQPEAPSPDLEKLITEVFDRVGGLRPMPYGSTYTLTVGGTPVTADPDYFLRRRTGAEILASGMTDGCGDNAIAALHLLKERGYETLFIDSAQISTESLQNGFSGHAVVAVHDTKKGVWVFVDPSRREFSWPWTTTDRGFYGNYWIGFRGPLADYPAHDPESLKKFYRDTLRSIPAEVLNQTLFRFRFTVDPSLIGADGKYLNPNLERLLRDNGKVLAAHGVHPVNEVAIRLTKGGDNAESRLEYSDQKGWVCSVGLRSAVSLGFVSYLEDVLNRARGGKGAPAGAGAVPPVAASSPMRLWMVWAGFASLCVAMVALLFWQRRWLAGKKMAIAYWACQLLGWGAPFILALAIPSVEKDGSAIATLATYTVSGILLTGVLRREIRRRRWLSLSTGRMLGRLGLAAVSLAAVQQILESGCVLAFHMFGTGSSQSLRDGLTGWAISILMMGAWIALYVAITGPRRHREVEVRLQLALREAELRALEAQINPHFLFNCLNSIRGLVVENPAMSQDMLTRLANILRYNLRQDVEHTVTLKSEVEIVGDYLALESVRFEDRLRVTLSIDPNAGEVQVPPMLLQTLVENALKHGIAPRPSGGDLLVRANVAGDSMVIEVENPGRIAESGPETTQLGLANIRERLRILYNGRAGFELKNRDGRVAATVSIPRTV